MAEPQQATTAPAGDWFATNGIKTIPIDADALLREATARAGAGDMEGANAAFFKIPADERKKRGVYAGPGGGDATGSGAMALGAATGLTNITRAVAGGVGVGGRVLAGAKEAVTQATPIVKYEATKSILTHMGVPEGAATVVALTVSGYEPVKKAAGKIPPRAATAGEAAATPAAMPEPPVTPVAASAPGPVAGGPAGSAPAAVPGPPASAAPVAAPSASPPAATGSAADLLQVQGEFHRLIAAGKSREEALALIEQQLALQQKLGLPSLDAVRRAVVDRNTSGRWRE